MATKTCTKCKIEKPTSEFHRCKEHRDGLKSNCKECSRISVREWGARNPEKVKSHVAKWRSGNKARVRYNDLRRLYGLSPQEFDGMMFAQEGACAICKTQFSEKETPHVDHCHSSDTIRGLLCRACNLGISKFKDDVGALSSAITYLSKSRQNSDTLLRRGRKVSRTLE